MLSVTTDLSFPLTLRLLFLHDCTFQIKECVNISETRIGHFWVPLRLCFKTSLSAKPFLKNEFCVQFHFHANQSHFNKNGFALRLALKQRHKGTRKWPIVFTCLLQWWHFFFSNVAMLITEVVLIDWDTNRLHGLTDWYMWTDRMLDWLTDCLSVCLSISLTDCLSVFLNDCLTDWQRQTSRLMDRWREDRYETAFPEKTI